MSMASRAISFRASEVVFLELILPLVPYLDTLSCVFIAVAIGGIALTIYAQVDDWRRGQKIGCHASPGVRRRDRLPAFVGLER